MLQDYEKDYKKFGYHHNIQAFCADHYDVDGKLHRNSGVIANYI